MRQDIERILISKEEISEKVSALAKQLSEEYAGKNPIVVCVLKGAVMFYADLVKQIDIPVTLDFIAISSYGSGSRSSGEVRLVKDLGESIEGRDVIIIEDILDSGYTLTYLKRILHNRGPKSIKLAVLLDKPSRREVPLEADYSCFTIDNHFVVGYGLDYDEKYRNFPEIGILKPEVYSN